MIITSKDIRDKLKDIDDFLLDQYRASHENKKTDWRTYEEQYALRIKEAMKQFQPLVNEAVDSIHIYRGQGRKPELTLKQRVSLLLLQRMIGKSNRMMASMLVIFSLLTNVDVSYKTIERLYSDEEVLMALHNLHVLILKKKGVNNADASGDGTGYALTISRHYASTAQKEKDAAKENSEGNKTAESKPGKKAKKRGPIFSANGINTVKKIFSERMIRFEKAEIEELTKMPDGEIVIKDVKKKRYIVKRTGDYFEIYSVKKGFAYSFKFMDLKTQMYIAYGTSLKSEKEAFDRAHEMCKSIDIKLKSVRLDKYYSYPSYVDKFGDTKVYIIPKKGATLKGSWKYKRTMFDFVRNTMEYLGEQYRREHSETGWSVDKRRFGWSIPQKREDRIDTADSCTTIWHNLFQLGGLD